MSQQTTYTIYPGEPPKDIYLSLLRGNSSSISLIARQKGTELPYNLGVYTGFSLQMRIHPLQKTPEASLTSEDFVLGQSTEGLAYIDAHNLDAEDFFDEVHVLFKSALLQNTLLNSLTGEVDALMADDERYTLANFHFRITHDSTR